MNSTLSIGEFIETAIPNMDKLSLLSYFLTNIVQFNEHTVQNLIALLHDWLIKKNVKKPGLLLLGVSNSGKLSLLKLFKRLFNTWECGVFQCPISSNPSNFVSELRQHSLLFL